MPSKPTLPTHLIAPCGMNCGICLGYTRSKKKCPGCRKMSEGKSEYCRKCIIANCEVLKKKNAKFCSPDICEKYPCKRLKNLDKRYRTKYGMSMLENLDNIKDHGIQVFVRNEKERWTCPSCGQFYCVHRWECQNCGEPRK